MLDGLKNHWMCLLVGIGMGWGLQFCPIFHMGHTCPFLNGEKVCQCETCCGACDCVEACTDDNCPCCAAHN